MKTHQRTLFAFICAIAIAVFIALAWLGADWALAGRDGNRVRETTHSASVAVALHPVATDASHAIAPLQSDEQHRAFIDMYTHAARYLDMFDAHPETFAGTSDWSANWSLHWMDVEHDGDFVRLYHATEKRHPRNRFTLMWDAEHGRWSSWEHAD